MIASKMYSQQIRLLAICLLLLLVSVVLQGQWYTDPENPVPALDYLDQESYIIPDLEGGAYCFLGPGWCHVLSHVNVEGHWWSNWVNFAPPTSCFSHTEILDPNNYLISHVEDPFTPPEYPHPPPELNKWSPTGVRCQHFIFPHNQIWPRGMVSNDMGGCIMLLDNYGWFIQYFDGAFDPRFGWTEHPLGEIHLYTIAALVSDGMGGAFAFWFIDHNSAHDIKFQHIRQNGNLTFPDSGYTVIDSCYSYNPYYMPVNAYASIPGSFIQIWSRTESEYHWTRFDSAGSIIWDYQPPDYNYVCSDHLGGLYFFQYDSIHTEYGRIDASGEVVFTERSLDPWIFYYGYRHAISEAGELAVLNWDVGDSVWTLRKYDSLGNQMWSNAVQVLYGMTNSLFNDKESLVADNRGGVIVYFIRPSGAYFTRVDAYGNNGSSLNIDPEIHAPDAFTFTIYPNPTNSAAYINLSGVLITDPIQIRIYDILGRQASSFQIKSPGQTSISLPLPISNLASGTYFISLENMLNRQSQVQKVIVLK